jgi:outer membrane lipopolysaccharide assembly protein LptE/RlpB
MRNKLLFFLASSLTLFVTGCGYHLAGTGPGISVDTKTIAIPTFRNHTFEPALESIMTMYVKDEFLTNSRLRVVNDSHQADLLLEGTILNFDLIPVAFDRTRSVVIEYRVKIDVDIRLQDLRSKEILWKDPILETTAEYFVSTDTSATRVAQDRAVAEASKHLAENLVSRVLEGPGH